MRKLKLGKILSIITWLKKQCFKCPKLTLFPPLGTHCSSSSKYLSVPPTLVSIISQSDYLHRFLPYNQHQLNEHRVQTQIVANKLQDISLVIVTDTNHPGYAFFFF